MSATSEARRSLAGYLVPAGAAALASCALIVAIHRESLRTLVSAHGLLHTAIAQQLNRAWPIARPENPFFAGEGLPYYWFYHYVGARIAATADVHPLIAIESLGLLAAALVWIAGAALGRELGWRPGRALAIGFLAFAGTNVLGPLFLLLKLASGRPWPADDGLYLWGLTHPVMGMIRWNDPGALYGPLINFFLNNSSRALALALALVLIAALRAHLARGSAVSLGGVAVASAACAACSPIVGPMAALVLSAALAADRLIAGPNGSWDRRALAASVAMLAGSLLPAPTYYHLFLRSTQSGVAIGFRPDLAATILVSAGPLLILAGAGLWQERSHQRFLRVLLLAGVALLCGNTLLEVPGSNESNLFHLAGFVLAVPAAGAFGVLEGWLPTRRVLAAAGLIAATAVAPALVLWSYWNRPPVALDFDGPRLTAVPADGPRALVYDCVRARTPASAVFVVDERLLLTTVLGNVPELPALTGRTLFVASDPDYLVTLYPDRPKRGRIARALLTGVTLDAADRALLTALKRPVYLLTSSGGTNQAAGFAARYGTPICQAGDIAVFAVPAR